MKAQEFVCPRCGNAEERFIGKDVGGQWYCRRCLAFAGKMAEPYVHQGDFPHLKLGYELTAEQKTISAQILAASRENRPVLIRAVTGAGKTELVYETIERFLQAGKSVGFATPRREVVLELKTRIAAAFTNVKVIAVCQGHTDELSGDIVVLTAHQLYRYKRWFDLLIFDEIDAFPYADNPLLARFFQESVRGTYILLSATPTPAAIAEITKVHGLVLELNVRHHKHPLPVPHFKKYGLLPYFDIYRKLLGWLKEGHRVFIFVPTIAKGHNLAAFLHLLLPHGTSVDAKDANRRTKIEAFRQRQIDYLVTTSVLERGVTFADLQVIIVDADDERMSAATLTQMAGRAGRIKGYESGEVVFFGRHQSSIVTQAIKGIEKSNEALL